MKRMLKRMKKMRRDEEMKRMKRMGRGLLMKTSREDQSLRFVRNESSLLFG